MTAKVESWFIEPLEKHYETKPKVGMRLTILSELSRYDETVLGNAQNWLKTNRKAQTFPSPAECISACRQFAASSAVSSTGVGLSYAQRVGAIGAAAGKNETFPMIYVDTPEYEAWRRYWRANREKTFIDLTRDLQKGKGWTVPKKWPWEFDLSYSAGDDMEARDD